MSTCHVCGSIHVEFHEDAQRDMTHAKCRVCGRYLFNDEAAGVLAHDKHLKGNTHLLSGAIRNGTERDSDPN